MQKYRIIDHNIIPRNSSTKSKQSTNLRKEHGKEIFIVSEVKRNKTSRNNAPTTILVGHSVLQNFFSHRLSSSLNNKDDAAVLSFPGAISACMEDYMKPTVRISLNQILIYRRTNNQPSN